MGKICRQANGLTILPFLTRNFYGDASIGIISAAVKMGI